MPTITAARPSDLIEVLRLIRALSAFHGDTATVTLEQLQSFFFDADAPAKALLARKDGKIVGYAGLLPHIRLHSGARSLDVQHLYVVETHRGRGIGRALIAAAHAHAKTMGCFRLTIGTDPNNTAAQAAYRAMGWDEITGGGPRFQRVLDDAAVSPPP